jgi:hypothetical protein
VSRIALCRCCELLLLVCEDIPMGMQPPSSRVWRRQRISGSCAMLDGADSLDRFSSIGAMNSYYLSRSALECLSKANGSAIKGIWRLSTASTVCDLRPDASTLVLAASLMTSFGMLMFKAAQVEVLSLKIKEGRRLRKEREELVVPLHANTQAPIGQQLAAALQPSASSHSPLPHAAPASLHRSPRHGDAASEPEFMTSRQLPPPAAGRSVQGAGGRTEQGQPTGGFNTLQAAEEVVVPVVRGVCDGCAGNVMSNDEGRWREDGKYYHLECIKGRCGGCGLIVHANDERVRLSGVYWHHDCDSDRAESSRAGAARARQEQSHS